MGITFCLLHEGSYHRLFTPWPWLPCLTYFKFSDSLFPFLFLPLHKKFSSLLSSLSPPSPSPFLPHHPFSFTSETQLYVWTKFMKNKETKRISARVKTWGSRVWGDVFMLLGLCLKHTSNIMICSVISKLILILLKFMVVWALWDGRLAELQDRLCKVSIGFQIT